MPLTVSDTSHTACFACTVVSLHTLVVQLMAYTNHHAI
jgi:hypothetical protein